MSYMASTTASLAAPLTAEIFVPYESTLLANVRADLIPDDSFIVTPVNFGDVCLNYDIAWFAENELALPESFADLTRDDYAGLLVVENPATSSPGLAFLLATIAEFGDDEDYNWIDYWSDLRDNDVLVADGWTDAYYSHFTIGSRGDGSRPLVVSYASSPPAEVLYGEDPEAGAVSARDHRRQYVFSAKSNMLLF